MKYLLIPFLALSILGCQPATIEGSCDTKVLENGKKWKTFDCWHSVPLENTWSMAFKANLDKKRYLNYQQLNFTNIPIEVGLYVPKSKLLEHGRQSDFFSEEGLKVTRSLMDEDYWQYLHLLDTLANNYLRIDSYDDETGMISGGFHTEWLKQVEEAKGPDRQILHCDHFEFQLDQREPVK